MNPVILDGASSLLAAWPLAIVALVIAWLVGAAFVRAGRPARGAQTSARGESSPSRTCRSAGHHYLKGAAGWHCSHCGDEIGHEARAPQGVREVAGV
ncbi:hypothetical protein GCM10009817_18500 [Terrabacter lapilli]|uniref:Uncharacterized protein n=1 Tax=Terrabacter lapilli TaxID=436231 RepID=A0ABP5DFN0_9MICO|nr:hypothetical protein [Terrabacter sp.]